MADDFSVKGFADVECSHLFHFVGDHIDDIAAVVAVKRQELAG